MRWGSEDLTLIGALPHSQRAGDFREAQTTPLWLNQSAIDSEIERYIAAHRKIEDLII